MKKISSSKIKKIRTNCKTCRVGSCCYEGAELTKSELREIIKYNPKVKKPWFRLVKNNEEPDPKYPFTTITRSGTCVFQDKKNQCLIYNIRPYHCRDFPFEKRKMAPYRNRLCSLFYNQWSNNAVKRTYNQREKK